jgi:hypothetical protein
MWFLNTDNKSYFSIYPPPTFIRLSHRFASASKPAVFDCCLSLFLTSVSTSSSAKHLPPSCEEFYVKNTSHHIQETLLYEYPLHLVLQPTKTHKRTPLFDSTLLKHRRHCDYQNQPLNMRMRVCYLDYHEAGLCCYLVIHIESLLHPSELFYFHLSPAYWLSLVITIFTQPSHL